MTGFSNLLAASSRQAMGLMAPPLTGMAMGSAHLAQLRLAIQELDRVGHGLRRPTKNNAEFLRNEANG